MARIPGPLGIVLNQAPLSPMPDGGVGHTASKRTSIKRGELIARATALAQNSSATRGFHCRRGETVMLDASASSPNARYFEWSLVVDELPVVETDTLYSPENPPPGRRAEGKKVGKQLTLLALASFSAILVAKDGVSESLPFRIEVRVQPREWKTSFMQRSQLQTFSKFYGANPLLENQAGENACSLCGMDVPSGHQIHRSKERLDWKEQFRVKEVDDPGGPFDRLWYVDKLDLRIDRSMYINSELTTGQVFRLNNKKDTPQSYREGLKARIECTKLHERLHGELVKQKLGEPGMDPAPRVELLIGDDEASLANQTNTEIALKENFLGNATTGPEGHRAVRERLEKDLKVTRVKFLLPQTRNDEQGVEIETNLLGFSD